VKPALLAALLAAGPLCAGLWAGQPAKPVAATTEVSPSQEPGVKREAMKAVEKSIDARLDGLNPADPTDLMGNTRGIYLPGFGVVLTSEVALVKVAGLSPFHQTITPEERTRAHARRLQALPKMKEAIKAALVSAASELRAVPLNEKIVFGVNLFYWSWEDTSGLPAQIVVQGTRQQLVSHLEAIQMQEF
jgi:hypothetical protein